MPKKKQSDFVEEITDPNSEFMKKFGSLTELKVTRLSHIFKPLGFTKNNFTFDDMYFTFSFRRVFEKSGFIIEPYYPLELYPYCYDDRFYYICKSPFEKAATRSTLELHLIMRAFVMHFLKESRDFNILASFVDELEKVSKIHPVDTYRMKSFGKIYLKSGDLRLGTFYEIVARNILSKRVRLNLTSAVVNSLVKSDRSIDLKVFKALLKFLTRINLTESISSLKNIDFHVVEKKKKFAFTGDTLNTMSLTPYNPYIDKSGELKIDKKSSKRIRKDTKKAQSVLQKHIRLDEEIVPKKKKKTPSNNEGKKSDSGTHKYVKCLVRKTEWTNKEIEQVAKNAGMMARKFVLMVNQYCDETFGDFLLLESDTGYEINRFVLENLSGKD